MKMFLYIHALVISFLFTQIAFAAAQTTFKVTDVWGTHFVKFNDSEKWDILKKNSNVPLGVMIRIMADGFIKLHDGSASVRLNGPALIPVTSDVFAQHTEWIPKLPFGDKFRKGSSAIQNLHYGATFTIMADTFPASLKLQNDELGIIESTGLEVKLWKEQFNGMKFKKLVPMHGNVDLSFSEPGLYTLETHSIQNRKKQTSLSFVRVLERSAALDKPLLPRDWQGHEKIVIQ